MVSSAERTGTTAIVCKRLGVNFIDFYIVEKYVKDPYNYERIMKQVTLRLIT
jgi:DNA modification methylase